MLDWTKKKAVIGNKKQLIEICFTLPPPGWLGWHEARLLSVMCLLQKMISCFLLRWQFVVGTFGTECWHEEDMILPTTLCTVHCANWWQSDAEKPFVHKLMLSMILPTTCTALWLHCTVQTDDKVMRENLYHTNLSFTTAAAAVFGHPRQTCKKRKS